MCDLSSESNLTPSFTVISCHRFLIYCQFCSNDAFIIYKTALRLEGACAMANR